MSSSGLVSYVVSLLLGYCIGSFPTAYLFVKWKTRIDIRKAGTGNVGARNTYDVTGSKRLGVVVLVIDLLKGVLAVVLLLVLFDREFGTMAISGIGAVLGHNYPVWINFKGGRGLATAAGVMLVLGWVFVGAWAIAWFIVNRFAHNVHIANVVATAVSPFVVLIIPVKNLPLFVSTTGGSLFIVVTILCLLILLRHVEPIIELRKSYTKSSL